jgi:predicted adenylyl cyclase CyaB
MITWEYKVGYKNREIEIKMLALGTKSFSLVSSEVEKYVSEVYPEFTLIKGNSHDWYWSAPKVSNADFVRLRKNTNGATITIKSTDKGDNTDRVEIDLDVDDYKQAKELMFSLHGDPKAKVQKKYDVYVLEDKHTNVSVYQIKDDDRVFIEVEATSRRRVKELTKGLVGGSRKFAWIQASLYQMFVQNKQMVQKDVESFLNEG